jgi:hypothetical protein
MQDTPCTGACIYKYIDIDCARSNASANIGRQLDFTLFA